MKTQSLKFYDEFSDPKLVRSLLQELHETCLPSKTYSFMEFCGGHTHSFFRFGLKELLPTQIKLIHGPGCPVCVLPRGRIDSCIRLLEENPQVILCTYADLMRVPGSNKKNFIQMKAQGFDIRMVYSPFDALNISQSSPEKKVVFLGIGFETTAPATALAIQSAHNNNVTNFYVYCLHLLTPPAIQNVIDSPDLRNSAAVKIDGFIGPGHVSTIIGSQPYHYFASEYQKPVVISGFAPTDLIQSLILLVQMINSNKAQVVNQYTRTVSETGNMEAQKLLQNVFQLRKTFDWRGLGQVPYSAFQISTLYKNHDAEIAFRIQELPAADHKACLCGSIIRGLKQPHDCQLFGKVCTPDNPIGSCMVSSEGSCAAYYHYQSYKEESLCPSI